MSKDRKLKVGKLLCVFNKHGWAADSEGYSAVAVLNCTGALLCRNIKRLIFLATPGKISSNAQPPTLPDPRVFSSFFFSVFVVINETIHYTFTGCCSLKLQDHVVLWWSFVLGVVKGIFCERWLPCSHLTNHQHKKGTDFRKGCKLKAMQSHLVQLEAIREEKRLSWMQCKVEWKTNNHATVRYNKSILKTIFTCKVTQQHKMQWQETEQHGRCYSVPEKDLSHFLWVSLIFIKWLDSEWNNQSQTPDTLGGTDVFRLVITWPGEAARLGRFQLWNLTHSSCLLENKSASSRLHFYITNQLHTGLDITREKLQPTCP